MAHLTATHGSVNLNIVYSLRILVAGESCNVIGEYFERGSKSEYKKRLTNVIRRILRRKRRILRSPMPNEHHVTKVGLCLSLRPLVL